MDGIVNNNSVTIYGNVINNGLIENLPSNCCVEVPCKIDSSGFIPQKIGKLPEHLAALMRTNINVQILTAEIQNIFIIDPLTSSNLSIDEILWWMNY